VEWNPGAVRLFGYPPEEARGKNLDDLVAPEGSDAAAQARTFTGFVLKQHAIPCTEATRYDREGKPLEVVLSGAPIVREGKTVGGVAIYKDISAQKRAQREVRKLLEEKELLLQEAHHRIKNDMFLIRSMLSLQAGRTEAGPAREALEEAGRRISIIGEMYSGLYQDGGFQWVSLASVLDRTLGELKRASHGYEIRDAAAAGEVGARQAVAIGIVLNELVTNAIKHASPKEGADAPVISAEAEKAEGEILLLRVRDNGAGFPEEVLRGRRGLGLDIVASMAEQYDGSVSLRNEGGGVAEVSLRVAWRPGGG
jgi:PAS domain S-box-containing protein